MRVYLAFKGKHITKIKRKENCTISHVKYVWCGFYN